MDNVAIKVDNVSKTFRLPHEKQNSIKGTLISLVRGGKRTYEKQRALKNVSFEIKKGEFFGIVGRNGSGKSTLLKIIAGIYSPSKGQIQVNGNLTPFIELGVGFSPELTGRENVFLNGALLGFNRKEVEAMYGDIVEFAELEKFMDQKLKNYSSGMQVRLAFSIAIRAKSDILLLDEVLAVGDAAFQQKCYDYFEKIKGLGVTVVFVSHDMETVKRFCDKALLINNGDLQFLGTPTEAADLYTAENETEIIGNLSSDNEKRQKQPDLDVQILDAKGKPADSFSQGDKIIIKLNWAKKLSPKPANAGIAIYHEGRMVFGSNTGDVKLQDGATSISQEIGLNLGPGKYTTVAALFEGENLSKAYIYEPKGPEFYIRKSKGEQYWEGLTKLEGKWIYDV